MRAHLWRGFHEFYIWGLPYPLDWKVMRSRGDFHLLFWEVLYLGRGRTYEGGVILTQFHAYLILLSMGDSCVQRKIPLAILISIFLEGGCTWERGCMHSIFGIYPIHTCPYLSQEGVRFGWRRSLLGFGLMHLRIILRDCTLNLERLSHACRLMVSHSVYGAVR